MQALQQRLRDPRRALQTLRQRVDERESAPFAPRRNTCAGAGSASGAAAERLQALSLSRAGARLQHRAARRRSRRARCGAGRAERNISRCSSRRVACACVWRRRDHDRTWPFAISAAARLCLRRPGLWRAPRRTRTRLRPVISSSSSQATCRRALTFNLLVARASTRGADSRARSRRRCGQRTGQRDIVLRWTYAPPVEIHLAVREKKFPSEPAWFPLLLRCRARRRIACGTSGGIWRPCSATFRASRGGPLHSADRWRGRWRFRSACGAS